MHTPGGKLIYTTRQHKGWKYRLWDQTSLSQNSSSAINLVLWIGEMFLISLCLWCFIHEAVVTRVSIFIHLSEVNEWTQCYLLSLLHWNVTCISEGHSDVGLPDDQIPKNLVMSCLQALLPKASFYEPPNGHFWVWDFYVPEFL